MSEISATPKFDEMMMAVFEMPEPETSYVSSLREQFITIGAAKTGRNTVKMRFIPVAPRLVWGAILCLVMVIVVLMGTSPTVATAMKRLLAYIPGVGSVEQSTTMRVLAEPVRLQREDAILTVEQLVAGEDQTVVIYRHIEPAVDYEQYVPPAEFAPDCPELILPDGSRMEVRFGHRMPSDGNGILYALVFDPLPANVAELKLSLTRLIGLPPGAGPEDWEISLKLKPAPEGTGYPVIEVPEIVPTQSSPASDEIESDDGYGISLAIENYVELPDGYLLEGSLRWTDPDISEFGVIPLTEILRDANGEKGPWETIAPVTMSMPDSQKYTFAYKLTGKDFAWPLTLLVEAVEVRLPANAQFQFDPGPNLQADQIVDLDVELPIGDAALYVDSAQVQENFDGAAALLFTLRSENLQVVGATLIDMDNLASGGGGGIPVITEDGVFVSKIYYENGLPITPVTVTVVDIIVFVQGPWQATWEPTAKP